MEADRVKADEKRLANESKPGIEKVIEELTRQNAEQRELLNSLSDSWRADCTRQHEETIAAIVQLLRSRSTSMCKDKAHASKCVCCSAKLLREERRALRYELGYLLSMKAKYGPGGEFEPD
ncbi:hypothetical protein B0H11DRAFT_2249649 [Mycena galericulata]|nr:hypothetical protein B0H11DRAFT_2249649 [Mycena galericulata]